MDTFAEVAARYKTIKPLISKYHTRWDDIRPLGDRRRKWERIAKVDENTYILHDNLGGGWGDRYVARPPITWRRRKSHEVVTIRPAIRPAYDTPRFQFLRKYLPWGLDFDNQNTRGVHNVNGVFIPRPTSLEDKTDYHLTFLRVEKKSAKNVSIESWKCITEPWPEIRPTVDKEKKKALRGDLEQFYEWMCSVGPLLAVNDYSFLQRIREELQEHAPPPDVFSQYGIEFAPRLATEIIKDYNHPLRTHLATSFLQREDIKSIRTIEDKKKFRGRYNSWANKTFDLMTMTAKEVTNDYSH